jgi:hypothetical protein
MKLLVLAAVWLASCRETRAPSQGSLDSTNIGNSSSTALVSTQSTSIDTLAPRELKANFPNDSTQSANMPPSTLPVPLECAPNVFARRDTIRLRMETPHGGYLGVVQPDGTIFFLIYPQLGDTTRKYSLVPSETFEGMSTFQFRGDVKAQPRVYGRDTLEPVFRAPGKYVLQLGDNLEGDGGTVHKCTVRLAAEKH